MQIYQIEKMLTQHHHFRLVLQVRQLQQLLRHQHLLHLLLAMVDQMGFQLRHYFLEMVMLLVYFLCRLQDCYQRRHLSHH